MQETIQPAERKPEWAGFRPDLGSATPRRNSDARGLVFLQTASDKGNKQRNEKDKRIGVEAT
jgi:hypothetical protein